MTNLELVQELYRSSGRKEFDAFRAIVAPDLEWIQMPGFPGGGHWRGPAEVIEKVFEGNDRRWADFGFETTQYLEAGSAVIVIGTYHGRHRLSGKSFSAEALHLFDLAGGRVIRFRQYTDTKLICDAVS